MKSAELKTVQFTGKLCLVIGALTVLALVVVAMSMTGRMTVVLFWGLPALFYALVLMIYGNQLRQAIATDGQKLQLPLKIMIFLTVLAAVGTLLSGKFAGLAIDGLLLVYLSKSLTAVRT